MFVLKKKYKELKSVYDLVIESRNVKESIIIDMKKGIDKKQAKLKRFKKLAKASNKQIELLTVANQELQEKLTIAEQVKKDLYIELQLLKHKG